MSGIEATTYVRESPVIKKTKRRAAQNTAQDGVIDRWRQHTQPVDDNTELQHRSADIHTSRISGQFPPIWSRDPRPVLADNLWLELGERQIKYGVVLQDKLDLTLINCRSAANPSDIR